jgi:hypothetical protein
MLDIYFIHLIIATIFVGINVMWLLNVFIFSQSSKHKSLLIKPMRLMIKPNKHRLR